MHIYLPVAETAMDGTLLIALGAVSGLLSGLFGVGGGFATTPLLIFAGIPAYIAVGTQSCQLAGTTLSGALAHWKRRQIDIRMGLILTAGSFLGTLCGVALFALLKQTGHVELTVSFGYMLLLGAVGCLMMRESWRSLQASAARDMTDYVPSAWSQWYANWPLKMAFPDSEIEISALAPVAIGFVCGVMVAIFGVGGGFILVPAMLYLLRVPVGSVNGTALFTTIFATAFATVMQAVVTHSVDLVLAFFLLLGSVAGAQFGIRLAQRLQPELARFLLALLILAVAAKLLFDMTATPANLFSLKMTFT